MEALEVLVQQVEMEQQEILTVVEVEVVIGLVVVLLVQMD
jgi:hypothetical protein